MANPGRFCLADSFIGWTDASKTLFTFIEVNISRYRNHLFRTFVVNIICPILSLFDDKVEIWVFQQWWQHLAKVTGRSGKEVCHDITVHRFSGDQIVSYPIFIIIMIIDQIYCHRLKMTPFIMIIMIHDQMHRLLSSSRLHLAWEDPLPKLILDWVHLKQERLPSLVIAFGWNPIQIRRYSGW